MPTVLWMNTSPLSPDIHLTFCTAVPIFSRFMILQFCSLTLLHCVWLMYMYNYLFQSPVLAFSMLSVYLLFFTNFFKPQVKHLLPYPSAGPFLSSVLRRLSPLFSGMTKAPYMTWGILFVELIFAPPQPAWRQQTCRSCQALAPSFSIQAKLKKVPAIKTMQTRKSCFLGQVLENS